MKLRVTKQKKPKNKSPVFSKGYSELRSRVSKGSKYTMSCYNCEYYYQGAGDDSEMCQNPDVLKYDMVITESNIYCNRWKLVHRTETAKSLFKKGR